MILLHLKISIHSTVTYFRTNSSKMDVKMVLKRLSVGKTIQQNVQTNMIYIIFTQLLFITVLVPDHSLHF